MREIGNMTDIRAFIFIAIVMFIIVPTILTLVIMGIIKLL